MIGKRNSKSKDNSNDVAIKQAEAALVRVREDAEALVQQFNHITPLYAVDLAQYLMKDAVTNKSEVTRSLGETALHELKQKFKETVDEIPQQSVAKLKSVRWAHLEPLPREQGHWVCSELSERTVKSLGEAVRDLIGGVGALLFEYGYQRDDTEKPIASLWQLRPGDTPRYAYELPDLTAPNARKFQELLKSYRVLISEDYPTATAALQNAIREKKAAEAQALWDKA